MNLKNDELGLRKNSTSSPRIIVPAHSGIGRGSATLKSRQQEEGKEEDARSAKFNEEYAKEKKNEEDAEITSEELQSSDRFDPFRDLG